MLKLHPPPPHAEKAAYAPGTYASYKSMPKGLGVRVLRL